MTDKKNIKPASGGVSSTRFEEVSIPINTEETVSGVISIPKGYSKGTGKALILSTPKRDSLKSRPKRFSGP
jgi:hypothetical protein